MEELGALNLYLSVGNDMENRSDYLGLFGISDINDLIKEIKQ